MHIKLCWFSKPLLLLLYKTEIHKLLQDLAGFLMTAAKSLFNAFYSHIDIDMPFFIDPVVSNLLPLFSSKTLIYWEFKIK